MYEKSYMHRDTVTNVVMTPCGTDFLATASQDGHLKFWKKMPEGIEFVKHYHSHLEPINDMAVRRGVRVCFVHPDHGKGRFGNFHCKPKYLSTLLCNQFFGEV